MEDTPRSTPAQGRDEIKEKKQKNTKKQKKTSPYNWAVKVFLLTLGISAIFGLLSSETKSFPVWAALLVLFFFVAVGIFFDTIGMAVVSADEKPFHAMAARKIRGAKKAIWLVRKADTVSSFCNDVIGDISGVMSGACAAAVAIRLFGDGNFWGGIIVSAVVSASIVGGKAIGKPFALNNSQKIVFFVAKALSVFSKKSK